MFRWLRDAMTLCALAGLCAVSAAGVFVAGRQMVLGSVPLPATETWRQLFDRDLTNDGPVEKRLALRSLERAGNVWQERLQSASPLEQQTLRANLTALAPLWLADEAERYFSRPEEARPAFLDQQIGRWRQFVDVRLNDGKRLSGLERVAIAAEASRQLNEWIEAVEPPRRDQARAFGQALVARVLSGR